MVNRNRYSSILVLAVALLAGCAGTEWVSFETCNPRYGVGGQVYMNHPCVGWSDGMQVGKDNASVRNGPYAPRKVLMIYRNERFIEAVVFGEAHP